MLDFGLNLKPKIGWAVSFCGTILTVARTGRYPASLVFWKPGLSSGVKPATASLPLPFDLVYKAGGRARAEILKSGDHIR